MDAAAFTAETAHILKSLYRVSYGIVGTSADAEDAVQQALLKGWKAKACAHPDRFRAWMTRIVINESYTILRYRKRVSPSDELPEGTISHAPDLDVIDAVMALPEKFRIPFIMKYVSSYKEREIAEALRLPLSTVKSRLAKARHTLRATLSDSEVNLS